jgi:hypothetical protein
MAHRHAFQGLDVPNSEGGLGPRWGDGPPMQRARWQGWFPSDVSSKTAGLAPVFGGWLVALGAGHAHTRLVA